MGLIGKQVTTPEEQELNNASGPLPLVTYELKPLLSPVRSDCSEGPNAKDRRSSLGHDVVGRRQLFWCRVPNGDGGSDPEQPPEPDAGLFLLVAQDILWVPDPVQHGVQLHRALPKLSRRQRAIRRFHWSHRWVHSGPTRDFTRKVRRDFRGTLERCPHDEANHTEHEWRYLYNCVNFLHRML